jgi:hypothetical protein
MKKKLPPAQAPLPKYRSDQAAAEYLETHSVTQLWDQLPEAKRTRPSAALKKSILERRARVKSARG